MKKYAHEDMVAALNSCGLERGATVLIHSSFIHLGRPVGFTRPVPDAVFEAIQEHIGPLGTIVVPTFNFSFCRGEPFVKDTTPSVGMGDLSEHVRNMPGAIRSAHPMQSVAAIGPAAERICGGDTRSSFDPGGPFDIMLELDVVGLLFGAPMQSFSFVHLAEERRAVPYRYWKDFTGEYGEERQIRTYAMFVRDLDINPVLKLSKVEAELRADRRIRSARLGAGEIQTFYARDFINLTLEKLTENPNWLID